MTALPPHTEKKLGLVIDLDTCVGCHACATSCKEWNAGGYSAPLTDQDAHGPDPHGTWLNRVHSYEVGDGAASRTVHFPALVPALRDAGLRHRLPDRRVLQARRRRHRAGQSRHLHRLQALLLGLPVRRAGIRLRRRHDEEVHAVRRPHLQRRRLRRRTASRPACAPVRPARGISATSAIRQAPCRSSSRSAKASTCCRRWASSRSTNTCRRVPRRDQAAAAPAASRKQPAATFRLAGRPLLRLGRQDLVALIVRCIPPIRSSSSPRPPARATAS